MKINQMTVAEIQRYLSNAGMSLSDDELKTLREDAREGVRRLYQQFCRHRALVDRERLHLEKMLLYEKAARRQGYRLIAGVDEAGRGPLAGPVVAAAVIMPDTVTIVGIDDSKKLTPAKRDRLYDLIREAAVSWAVGIASVEEIDALNILRASLLAMKRAVEGLDSLPQYVLVDAVQVPGITIPQLPIVKGDGKSISIAAASIMAKVTRDRMMDRHDREFPLYGFSRHKGYGTAEHIAAIKSHGTCPLHRKAFIRNIVPEDSFGSFW